LARAASGSQAGSSAIPLGFVAGPLAQRYSGLGASLIRGNGQALVPVSQPHIEVRHEGRADNAVEDEPLSSSSTRSGVQIVDVSTEDEEEDHAAVERKYNAS
jgi:hypothetical protein